MYTNVAATSATPEGPFTGIKPMSKLKYAATKDGKRGWDSGMGFGDFGFFVDRHSADADGFPSAYLIYTCRSWNPWRNGNAMSGASIVVEKLNENFTDGGTGEVSGNLREIAAGAGAYTTQESPAMYRSSGGQYVVMTAGATCFGMPQPGEEHQHQHQHRHRHQHQHQEEGESGGTLTPLDASSPPPPSAGPPPPHCMAFDGDCTGCLSHSEPNSSVWRSPCLFLSKAAQGHRCQPATWWAEYHGRFAGSEPCRNCSTRIAGSHCAARPPAPPTPPPPPPPPPGAAPWGGTGIFAYVSPSPLGPFKYFGNINK